MIYKLFGFRSYSLLKNSAKYSIYLWLICKIYMSKQIASVRKSNFKWRGWKSDILQIIGWNIFSKFPILEPFLWISLANFRIGVSWSQNNVHFLFAKISMFRGRPMTETRKNDFFILLNFLKFSFYLINLAVTLLDRLCFSSLAVQVFIWYEIV